MVRMCEERIRFTSVSPLVCKNFAAVCFSPMTGARLLTSTHHFYVPRYSLAMDKFIDS